MGGARTTRGNKFPELWQCRVIPKIRWPYSRFPPNYDSLVVFPTEDAANKYLPTFINQLLAAGYLYKVKEYTTSLINLQFFDQGDA